LQDSFCQDVNFSAARNYKRNLNKRDLQTKPVTPAATPTKPSSTPTTSTTTPAPRTTATGPAGTAAGSVATNTVG
jgi:hypothetical protein